MTSLIAVLSTGKGSWGNLGEIINREPWDSIFLVTNRFGKENFGKRIMTEKKVEFIVLDFEEELPKLVASIVKSLEGKIPDFEVALNIISGEGKEHTAVISAILKLGLSMRIVALSRDGSVIEP
ncbi:hypothetical protein COT07_01990 [Candidatus Woesearchaeota archaeon CG07_land_8_20_14_0_80_44_23]|nr:MAG: hypothetical protein COT07_01990 [Candidatus Woesearchaeota archaeon CG07_land_8_20_14_0_80_44_23]